MIIKQRIDERRLLRKLKRLRAENLKRATKTVQQMTTAGMWYAKSIVPVWTGQTQKSIKTQMFIDSKGPRGLIKARNEVRPGFELVSWMSASNGILNGQKHIKSGDPRFLLSTKKWLNDKKGRYAKGNFSGLSIR
jgi:hypothetical protein